VAHVLSDLGGVPNRDMWMWGNLVDDAREQFFLHALELAAQAEAVAIVVIEDRQRQTATNAATHEDDVVTLLLERINNLLGSRGSEGVVICDRPGGDRPEENAFLASCLETLQLGTAYVRPDRIPINVVSTDSRLIRLLQLTDVVTSCTLALVCGEPVYAPRVFAAISPLLRRDGAGNAGGFGLKIHPDFNYVNLYHWLLDEDVYWRGSVGEELPSARWPYAESPDRP
jgi:hypothetical protein